MKRLLFLTVLIVSVVSCRDINDAGVHYARGKDLQVPTDANGYTSEQRNIMQRREVVQKPDSIMWIYCLAQTGNVVFYGPVKGKVTSSGKVLITRGVDYTDGTVGGSDAYVYWFDPSGKYFQWNGNYFLSTFEIRVNSPVINHRNVQ